MLHEKTGCVIPHYKGLKNTDKYSIKRVLFLLSPELLYFEVAMVAEKLMSNEQISNDSNILVTYCLSVSYELGRIYSCQITLHMCPKYMWKVKL